MSIETDLRTLQATEFLDCDSQIVADYTDRVIGSEQDPVKQVVKLFYAVRDRIRYDVYGVDMSRQRHASQQYHQQPGWLLYP